MKNIEGMPIADLTQKVFGFPSNLGWNRLGKIGLGCELEFSGIFRVDSPFGHKIQEMFNFATQWKPRTANQISCGVKFKNGMAAWSALTPEEKDVYNNRAKLYRMEGVNVFMREWMRS